jgi:hypothetical protein
MHIQCRNKPGQAVTGQPQRRRRSALGGQHAEWPERAGARQVATATAPAV